MCANPVLSGPVLTGPIAITCCYIHIQFELVEVARLFLLQPGNGAIFAMARVSVTGLTFSLAFQSQLVIDDLM